MARTKKVDPIPVEGTCEIPIRKMGFPMNEINPRWKSANKDISEDEAFKGLVDSIRSHGVLQPILVRPSAHSDQFEIICGLRRYRAVLVLAMEAGDGETRTIPAFVRQMDDEQAKEAALIENLQREDLTEAEEAQFFKAILITRGKDGAEDLAVKLGVSPRYIRRRARVAEMPTEVLEAWESGELQYGHVEQLARLEEPDKILEMLKKWRGNPYQDTVRDLERLIDGQSVLLAGAQFDKIPCRACIKNSTVQRKMFEVGDKDAQCLDAACFKKKTAKWMDEHFTSVLLDVPVQGWRFADDLDYEQRRTFYGPHGSKCPECPSFVVLISRDGKSYTNGPTCIGDKKCFNLAMQRQTQSEEGEGDEPKEKKEAPRVSWHGEFYREAFLVDRLSRVIRGLGFSDEKVIHLALLALFVNKPAEAKTFFDEYGENVPLSRPGSIGVRDLLPRLKGMDGRALLRDVCSRIILDTPFSPPQRRVISEYLGIDLSKEWRITPDYLGKKTVSELIEIGEQFHLWEREEVVRFLSKRGVRHGDPRQAKKGDLVKAIMESGTDLAGVVPDEILKGPNTFQDHITSSSATGQPGGSTQNPDYGIPGDPCENCERENCDGCGAEGSTDKESEEDTVPPCNPCTGRWPNCNGCPCEGCDSEDDRKCEDCSCDGCEKGTCESCEKKPVKEDSDNPFESDEEVPAKPAACEECKKAHPKCTECCKECFDPCNAAQHCRLEADI
jgi:ParB/RepB/Spo0J family partition protein